MGHLISACGTDCDRDKSVHQWCIQDLNKEDAHTQYLWVIHKIAWQGKEHLGILTSDYMLFLAALMTPAQIIFMSNYY